MKIKNCVILVMIMFVFSGCASKEAKEVIKKIDSIGEVSYSQASCDLIISADNAYDALSEKDKENVKNQDVLIEAIDNYTNLHAQNFDKKIAIYCNSKKPASSNEIANTINEMVDLINEYHGLTDNVVTKIKNYDKFYESYEECLILWEEDVVKRIKEACEKYEFETADDILSKKKSIYQKKIWRSV